MPTADDHRSVAQTGIVALFDRRIESIAIEMSRRKSVQFSMTDQPWGAAGPAAAIIIARGREAIPAETQSLLVDPLHGVSVAVIMALRSHPKWASLGAMGRLGLPGRAPREEPMYKLYNVKRWGSISAHLVLEELGVPYQNIWLTP
jgi:hypothetical protein